MNFYDVVLNGSTVTFKNGEKINLPDSVLSKLNGRQGELILGIRGEDIKLQLRRQFVSCESFKI